MAEKLVEKHTVACYEADRKQTLRPTALLDWMQEAAGRNAETLGFGYDDMIASNTAWVLSRTHIIFNRYPKWREEVSLKTWHKGANRLFYLRDFVLEDAQGEPLALATTSWLIVNSLTHRLVTSRTSAVAAGLEEGIAGDAIAEPADKVAISAELEMQQIGVHKVAASDIDYVGHANNVKYVVWTLDALAMSGVVPTELGLKELLINYDAEVLEGDNVSLYCACESGEGGECVCYIRGSVEESKTNFSMRLTFGPM